MKDRIKLIPIAYTAFEAATALNGKSCPKNDCSGRLQKIDDTKNVKVGCYTCGLEIMESPIEKKVTLYYPNDPNN